ncbi:hypothetical protein AVEN_195360-1 [Araneus ventricosus]|uniref:Uncharacterized protein n=1 Tax=Araneus ventricosus TaxID=182803 RepID=A0A4Y2DJS8_ARAVE|nr:hypothetical protein AVEN_195360-1 [Araneus ventricosus]
MYWNYRVPGIRIGFIYLTGPALDIPIYFAFYCGPSNLDKLPAEHFQLFEVMLQDTGYNSAPGYFGTNLFILKRDQMTRTTPEPAPPLQTSAPYQRGDVWSLRMI